METQSKYTHEQIQEWQKANNMEVFSLTQLCAVLMKFEERQNEIARYTQAPTQIDIRTGQQFRQTLFDKWNNQ